MLVVLTTGALAFSACSHDEDLYDPNGAASNQKTEENFMAMVGSIDRNQTWETVTDVEVNMPVNYGIGGMFNVVYYANGKVVGATTVADGQTLKGKVSVPSYTKELSVSLSTDKGLGTIVKLPVGTQQNAPARRAATRSTASNGYTAGEAVEYTAAKAFERVYPGEYETPNWGSWDNNPYVTGTKTPYVWPHKFYYVDNAINGMSVKFTDSFINKVETVFGGDNGLSDETRNLIVQDYGLVTAEDGPVKLRYVSGASSNHAAIGYFIYKDDPANVQNLDVSEAGMFNLLSSTYPEKLNWSGNNCWAYEGVVASNPTATLSDLKTCNKYVVIDDMKAAGLECGDEIQLTYYDEQGNPSAYFPKGTKIGFFIVPSAGTVADHTTGTIDTRYAVYSFSQMNVEPHQCPGYFATGWNSDTYATSHVATFKVGNDVVVGFEDANNYNSSDFDYNDFVFTIVGDFQGNIPEVEDPNPGESSTEPEETPEVQQFTYCFEDMDINGGDYDFNDCVLKVTSPVNGKIEVTLAAAGGTYRLRAGLGDSYLFEGEELHSVFGVSTSTMVNTGLNVAPEVTTTVAVNDSWTLAKDGNFWIEVVDRNVKVYVPAFTPGGFTPGNVPYAIRIASDFEYPEERIAITLKYPAFKNWAQDATKDIDWYVK